MWSSILVKTPSNCNLCLHNLTLSDDCFVSLGTNKALDLNQYLGGYGMGDTYSRDSFRIYVYICMPQVAKAVPCPEDLGSSRGL